MTSDHIFHGSYLRLPPAPLDKRLLTSEYFRGKSTAQTTLQRQTLAVRYFKPGDNRERRAPRELRAVFSRHPAYTSKGGGTPAHLAKQPNLVIVLAAGGVRLGSEDSASIHTYHCVLTEFGYRFVCAYCHLHGLTKRKKEKNNNVPWWYDLRRSLWRKF